MINVRMLKFGEHGQGNIWFSAKTEYILALAHISHSRSKKIKSQEGWYRSVILLLVALSNGHKESPVHSLPDSCYAMSPSVKKCWSLLLVPKLLSFVQANMNGLPAPR